MHANPSPWPPVLTRQSLPGIQIPKTFLQDPKMYPQGNSHLYHLLEVLISSLCLHNVVSSAWLLTELLMPPHSQ